MNKIVLISDIIASKKIKNRAAVQKKLNEAFKKINSSNKNIISPFTITLGDEFQAVYNSAENLFKNIWQISAALFPEKSRYSIASGEISTKINKEQAIGMDGPAFYFARKGLEDLKQSDFIFNYSEADDKYDLHLIQQSLFLISHQSYNWKATRIAILIMMYEGLSAKEISKKLKISNQAVYKNITAGALDIIVNLTTEIEKNINEFVKRN